MTFCEKCGSQVAVGSAFCASCGAATRQVGQQELTKPQPKPTKAWYLVPFFFNILGGIIGYFAVRNDDRQMANRLLIFGLVMFVLTIVVYFVVIFTSLMMLSSL